MPENRIISDTSLDNKRIAKNTILLYVRMLLTLGVSLYISRVVLTTLGVEDYGLYNVVGGIVTMFTFISSAMSNSTQRFITFELGKESRASLENVFGAACIIHVAIALLIVILSETVGLWFLYNKMIIPEARLEAAFWTFQFSIISSVFAVVSIPYNSLIVAHEKMGAFAFISIIDVLLKLLIVYLIQVLSYDKLIMYAFFILIILCIDCCIYSIYCKRNFEESRRLKFRRNPLIKGMISFAGWSLIGNLSVVGYTQGLNLLLNMFFGPTINAARGVAVQVQAAVGYFVSNFQTAVNPQITKSYAIGNFDRLHNLIFTSSKMSFFLLLCLSLPIFLEAEFILSLWLKDVPEHTVSFLRLILLITLLDTLSNPIGIGNNATGKIKIYQIFEGGLLLSIFPVSYVFLKFGYRPESVFVVQFLISVLVQIVRVFLVRKKLHFSPFSYLNRVVTKIFVVMLVSVFMSLGFHLYLPLIEGFIRTFLVCVFSVLCVLLSSYYFGLEKQERQIVDNKISLLIAKIVLKKNNEKR